MFKKEKKYIGISYVDDCLKVAQFKITATEKRIVGIVKKDVPGFSPEELSQVTRGLLSELGVSKPTAICALAASAVTTKNIEVPSVDPAEIKSIIDLQAGRHTPYAREEILIGYITIGVFQRNYTKVLLVIVNRDQILKQLGFMVQAGVKVEKVVFAPEATAMYYWQMLNLKEDDKPIGIIDISHQTTDFIIAWNKTIVTSRSIPVGMNHLIKEGQPAQEKLLTELMQSVEVYQGEDIGPLPTQYVLACDDSKLTDLQPLLQDKLKTSINVMPYLDHISAPQPVMLKLVSEYNDDSFLNIIASGSMSDQLRLDLTPAEIRSQRAIEEKGKQIIFVGIYCLIILALVCAIFFSKIYFRSIYLKELKADSSEKQKLVDALEQVSRKTQIIKGYAGERLVALDIVKTLYRLIPEEIYLQSITVEEDGTIDLQGTSESMSRVFNLVTALEDSALFKGVKTKSTSSKQERGKDVAVFEITFRLESAPDEEKKEIETPEVKANDKDPQKVDKKGEK